MAQKTSYPGTPDILIVDDKKNNLIALDALLEECDATVHKALSGNEALSLLTKQEFALVLLDVQMPGMDGFEVAELMRLNPITRHIPIIFVTAISKDHRNIFKGYEAGAVDYLQKPIEPLILRGKVNIFLDLWRQRYELSVELIERKKVEKALYKSEAKYRELVEQSPIGLALCSMDGQLISVNPAYAKIIGLNVGDTLKLSYWDITPEKFSADEKIQLEQLLKTGRYGPYEKEYRHKDGHLVPVRLNGMIVYRDEEKFIWSSVEDITALKKAEQKAAELSDQLRQSHKMEAIGTLAGGIAHDFNNILAAILGYADMAMNDTPEDSPAKYNITQVLKAGNRARELVKHILSFSRKETTQRFPVPVHLIVKEALKLLRASIPATIEIKQNIDPECGNILADSTQIHQVLMNLCTNAAQAMNETGGVLGICLSSTRLDADDLTHEPNLKPGHYIRISVEDHGAGIDQQHLDRIYDPYFTTKAIGEGSGMGLAVVIGIVKSHDGIITVSSKPGVGTTFTVYFPKVEAQPEKEITKTVPLPTGREKILIVDDEKSIVDLTAMRLKRLGYQATTRTSSKDALELFRSRPEAFDLVISDQTMPELTGEELAKKLQEIRPDIPIIICSGYSSKMDVEEASYLGISAFITKPVEIRAFAETIRKALER